MRIWHIKMYDVHPKRYLRKIFTNILIIRKQNDCKKIIIHLKNNKNNKKRFKIITYTKNESISLW